MRLLALPREGAARRSATDAAAERVHASERHLSVAPPRRLTAARHRIAGPVGPVTVETVISAPREAVFDFVGDLANHVAFTDHFMSDFRLARAKSDGLGAAARFRLENPGPKQWAEVAVRRSSSARAGSSRKDIPGASAVTSSGPSGISCPTGRRPEWS